MFQWRKIPLPLVSLWLPLSTSLLPRHPLSTIATNSQTLVLPSAYMSVSHVKKPDPSIRYLQWFMCFHFSNNIFVFSPTPLLTNYTATKMLGFFYCISIECKVIPKCPSMVGASRNIDVTWYMVYNTHLKSRGVWSWFWEFTWFWWWILNIFLALELMLINSLMKSLKEMRLL